jgi:hypothetical protein
MSNDPPTAERMTNGGPPAADRFVGFYKILLIRNSVFKGIKFLKQPILIAEIYEPRKLKCQDNKRLLK